MNELRTDLDLEATRFARAGRASVEELTAQIRHSLSDPCFNVVLEAVHGYVAVLNEHRQILGANQALLDALNANLGHSVIGLRVGEAFNCVHFTEGTDGCGTSTHCRTCGAVLAVLAAQAHDRSEERECRLTVLRDNQLQAVDFQVRATPLHLAGATVTAAVFQDVSAVKRREVLEQVFFHDLLNTLGGIAGWTELMKSSDQQFAAREIASLAEGLKDEILSQRTLLEAERGDLTITSSRVDASDLVARLTVIFEHHPAAEGKLLRVRALPDRRHLRTDPVLLLRVLVNMVKNAFEASPAGAAVELGFEWVEARPSFVVHNDTVIPDDVREHIFERSYSTKARHGRGTGTYSMKLYGENYLHGSVTFTSDAASGTTFRMTLPPDEQAERPTPSRAQAEPAVQNRRVLLVDDSEQLLRLGTLMLTRLGYEVTGCHSGVEALAALSGGEPYAVMVTDWMMEGMGGGALIEAVARTHPALPIVVCSGYGDAVGATAPVRRRIGKPFTLKELQSTLDAVLSN